MARQILDIGTAINDGTGDTLRVASGKINANFTEVYGFKGDITSLQANVSSLQTDVATLQTVSNSIPADLSDLTDTTNLLFSRDYDDLTNKPTIPDLSAVSQSIVPDTDVSYDLGTLNNRFRDLYLSGNTIYIGDSAIQTAQNGGIILTDYTTIPNIAEYRFKPAAINGNDQNITVPYSVGTVIDHLTYLQAGYFSELSSWPPDFSPSTYACQMRVGPNPGQYLTDYVSLVDAQWYPEASNGESVNTDNLIMLAGTVDTNDPSAIAAAIAANSFTSLPLSVISEGQNKIDGPFLGGNISGVWDNPQPATISEALDRLAFAIYQLNGNVPI